MWRYRKRALRFSPVTMTILALDPVIQPLPLKLACWSPIQFPLRPASACKGSCHAFAMPLSTLVECHPSGSDLPPAGPDPPGTGGTPGLLPSSGTRPRSEPPLVAQSHPGAPDPTSASLGAQKLIRASREPLTGWPPPVLELGQSLGQRNAGAPGICEGCFGHARLSDASGRTVEADALAAEALAEPLETVDLETYVVEHPALGWCDRPG